MVDSPSPSLAKIKNTLSETEIRALLTIAVGEVCSFFNVGKNMNAAQIALTVDLIIDRFWYFKLEEIKYCFRRAMMREKLFDRLDGNIIIGWLREYDSERTEEAIRLSEQKESEQLNCAKEKSGSVSFSDYVASLRERAKSDPRSAELLNQIDNRGPKRFTMLTNEERSRRDHEFKLWRTFSYLLDKKQ